MHATERQAAVLLLGGRRVVRSRRRLSRLPGWSSVPAREQVEGVDGVQTGPVFVGIAKFLQAIVHKRMKILGRLTGAPRADAVKRMAAFAFVAGDRLGLGE